MVLTAIKNHYTYARGKLSGVHIGVYQSWYSVLFSSTLYMLGSPKPISQSHMDDLSNSSQSDTLHNLVNIFYTGIFSVNLGAPIGVCQP